MGVLKVNPEAEVKSGFEAVKPGTYRLRIKQVEDRNPEKNDLKLTLEHVLPAMELLGVNGEPLKGQAGSLFDYVMLDYSKQWKLRQLVEAVGLPWGDFDPKADLEGREVDAVIKIEEYEGEKRNKLSRYVGQK